MALASEFVAGESQSWLITPGIYTVASGFVHTYHFRGVGTLDVTGALAADGRNVVFEITSAQSQALPPGDYFYQSFATKGAVKKLLFEGVVRVRPNLAAQAAGFDGRSYAEVTLEAVTKALNGTATDGVQGYVIQTPHGSREIRNYGLAELTDLHRYFSGLVAKERVARSGGSVVTHQFYSFGRA